MLAASRIARTSGRSVSVVRTPRTDLPALCRFISFTQATSCSKCTLSTGYVLHQTREHFQLFWSQIAAFTFYVPVNQVNAIHRVLKVVDDSRAATLSAPFREPTNLPQPAASTNHIARFRLVNQRRLKLAKHVVVPMRVSKRSICDPNMLRIVPSNLFFLVTGGHSGDLLATLNRGCHRKFQVLQITRCHLTRNGIAMNNLLRITLRLAHFLALGFAITSLTGFAQIPPPGRKARFAPGQ